MSLLYVIYVFYEILSNSTRQSGKSLSSENTSSFKKNSSSYLVVNSFAITVDLDIKKLEQPGWEELEVLHVGLFGRAGRFGRFWLVDPHQLFKIGVDGVVGFALTFGRLDPVRDARLVVRLTEVLPLELVNAVRRVHGEILEGVLTQILHLFCHLFRLFVVWKK